MITIRISGDRTKRLLERFRDQLAHPADMMAESATRVERKLRGHFSERDNKGNKLGGRRTHFWADIANSVAIGEVTDTQATIEIGDARFGQKLRGGTIVAKTARMLTIPVDPEAHGRRASVFERETGLKLIFIRQTAGRGSAILATRVANSPTLHARYVLKRSVTQQPDPQALPPKGELEREARQGVEDYLDTEFGGAS